MLSWESSGLPAEHINNSENTCVLIMIKTMSLDEAGYLYYKGLHPKKIINFDSRSSVFEFKDKDAEKFIKLFRSGKALINPQRYMYSRQAVKHMQNVFYNKKVDYLNSKKLIEVEKPQQGDHYYCIENGSVIAQTYANNELHNNRFKKGNYYITKNLALDARKLSL